VVEKNRGYRGKNQPHQLGVVELAEAQHGVATRSQLMQMGLSDDAIYRQTMAGRLHAVHAGVYAVGHRLLTVRGKWMAAVLACGDKALLSHRAAAALWDIAPIPSGDIDVLVTGRSRGKRRGIRPHLVRSFDALDRTRREGIPVTGVARTLFDLAELLNPRQLRNAFERGERLRLLDVRDVERLCENGTGRRGLRTQRALIAARAIPPNTNEGLEREFRDFCDEYRLELPVFNAVIGPYTVDAVWQRQRLIVELDSRAYHDNTAAFEQDRARDIDLQVWGYRVLRITAKRLREEPAAVAAAIRALLNAAA
jgi:very-short-patch-repair endonuclease